MVALHSTLPSAPQRLLVERISTRPANAPGKLTRLTRSWPPVRASLKGTPSAGEPTPFDAALYLTLRSASPKNVTSTPWSREASCQKSIRKRAPEKSSYLRAWLPNATVVPVWPRIGRAAPGLVVTSGTETAPFLIHQFRYWAPPVMVRSG